MKREDLMTLAAIVALVGIPLLAILPEPELESAGETITATIHRQTQTESATYFTFSSADEREGVIYHAVELPKNAVLTGRCVDNRFEVVE